MRTKLLPLASAAVLACVTAATGLAAGSTVVTHFSFTTPRHQLCGIWGTAVVHGTSVFRDTGNGTYFRSGTFVDVSEYTGDPNNPVGDLISETLSLDGPHPDLLTGGCEVLVPYLQGP